MAQRVGRLASGKVVEGSASLCRRGIHERLDRDQAARSEPACLRGSLPTAWLRDVHAPVRARAVLKGVYVTAPMSALLLRSTERGGHRTRLGLAVLMSVAFVATAHASAGATPSADQAPCIAEVYNAKTAHGSTTGIMTWSADFRGTCRLRDQIACVLFMPAAPRTDYNPSYGSHKNSQFCDLHAQSSAFSGELDCEDRDTVIAVGAVLAFDASSAMNRIAPGSVDPDPEAAERDFDVDYGTVGDCV